MRRSPVYRTVKKAMTNGNNYPLRIAFVLMLALAACSSGQESTGSESHFLTCQHDRDCNEGSCEDGYCELDGERILRADEDRSVATQQNDQQDSGAPRAGAPVELEQCANAFLSDAGNIGPMIQPADIVFAIDTSGTMKEELGFIQDNMNQFSQQIVDSGIDVHVIVIASPFDPESPIPENLGICIDAPLGSGDCPNDDNLPAYLHVPRHVPGYNGLNAIIDTYDQWSTNLRPEASKSIVVVSDDNASYPPNDSAAAFTTNLQALDPEMWANWTFSGIFAARECEATSNIGTTYIDLVVQTGGVGGELCDQEFQPVFDRLAEQIVTGSGQEIACE